MSVPLLVAGTLAFMSLGLLAGALAKTQEGAVNLANFLVLPMAFLSGSFFPLDGAPRWLQVVSRPAAAAAPQRRHARRDGARPGSGCGARRRSAILLGFAAVVTLVAVRLFRWEAD